jgi:putative ATP-dependent endonuclease of OLD family
LNGNQSVRINRLKIQNFRSIQELDFELPNVCALVGPNNAGKTNILDAMRKLLARDWGPRVGDFSEDDVYGSDPDLDIEIAVSFDEAISYAKLKDAEPVLIGGFQFTFDRYERGEASGQRRLNQRLMAPDGRQITSIQATYPKKGQPPRFEPLFTIPQEVREQVPVIHIGINRALQDQLPSARHSLLRRIFEEIDKRFRDPEETIVVRLVDGSTEERPRLSEFYRLMRRAMELLRTEDFKQLESAIKRNALEQLGLDPKTDEVDLYFTPMASMDFYKCLDLVVKEGDFSMSATRMGGGMQNAIVMAVLRAFEETRRRGAIILLEEPEMFLHPTMQRSLYETLRRIGETNQVIYTTHSPNFVSVPEFRDIVLVRKHREHGTKVIRSELPADTWRVEKFRQTVDRERSELFFAQRVLLVEGDTERLALPEFARKLSLDLDRAGATIIEVGGKRNLGDFAELAISLRIPTGVVYDLSSDNFSGDPGDEQKFNTLLDSLATDDGTVRVWPLVEDYESYLRGSIGEKLYTATLAEYPSKDFGKGKPRRQRMLAADDKVPVPPLIEEILRWLVPA